MDKNKFWFYKTMAEQVIQSLKRNNIDAIFCETSDEAKKRVLSMIPKGSTVGMAGSVTIRELGLLDELSRGDFKLYNQYLPNLSKEESAKIRKEGTLADFFLSGTNAVTLNGELVNISAMGSKIAGLTYAKKVIIVSGVNKIVKDVKEGIDRTRNIVAPMNAKRLDFNTPCKETGFCDYSRCRPPDYHRICNQLLVIEGERERERITVVLIGEELGF
ncbi:MAG: hypothetical protein AMJ90_00595 [candidate division Zixibacteria bacterium SM23_73_2]|nr:MAG: hypothetical protein AMJ90_00595 [candidate division Zixibacteria bacterium SM23_73_2]